MTKIKLLKSVKSKGYNVRSVGHDRHSSNPSVYWVEDKQNNAGVLELKFEEENVSIKGFDTNTHKVFLNKSNDLNAALAKMDKWNSKDRIRDL